MTGRRIGHGILVLAVVIAAVIVAQADDEARGGCCRKGKAAAAETATKGCGGGCGGGCGRAAGQGQGQGQGQGHGQGQGKGQGYGAGQRHGAQGPAAGASHHDMIQYLLEHHAQIERTVEEIDGGVRTVTLSVNSAVTDVIRQHVRQMQARMESGHGMRHWDPMFVELFEHHDAIRMDITDVPGGVEVRETSDDPAVVGLIRHHARRAVSEFVESGFDRAHEPTPLPDGYVAEGGE